jgi:hypothetical protein
MPTWNFERGFIQNSAEFHRARCAPRLTMSPTTNLFPQSGYEILLHDDGRVTYTAPAMVDDDGSDNRAKDPCWQRETSLMHNGEYLDAETVSYGALPPDIIKAVPGVVLGCRGTAYDPRTGRTVELVAGDVAPHLIHKRLGEISMAACRELGISPSPINGGEDDAIIQYTWWPGVAARGFALQAYHG